MAKRATAKTARNGGDLGCEADLFKAADKRRSNMEPSDDKHVALGLIFLKWISGNIRRRDTARVVEAML
ncbi:MAG: hypothetical protein MZU84_02650 [Sphingobacterium sp.]|nr:hypothetical protein [Sphingobacterium sp.]